MMQLAMLNVHVLRGYNSDLCERYRADCAPKGGMSRKVKPEEIKSPEGNPRKTFLHQGRMMTLVYDKGGHHLFYFTEEHLLSPFRRLNTMSPCWAGCCVEWPLAAVN